MSIELSANEQKIIEAAHGFALDYLAPNAKNWELARAMPADMFEAAAKAGLCGLLVKQDHDGADISFTALLTVLEILASQDMAAAFALIVHVNLARTISHHGSEDQIARHLPAMLAGKSIGAFLLTEAKGGSDAANIACHASPDGDGWRLHGEKAWITNSATADLLCVYAQTDPGAGWRGIAAFLVDADRHGVIREEPYDMLGGHALSAGGFRFADCKLDPGDLLVPSGRGFKAAMAGIDIARASVAAMCCGMLRSALDCATARARSRTAFGQPLAEFQGLQWQLAEVATNLHATRLMAFEAARLIDRDGNAVIAAAHAKKFATRAALSGISQCMQAMGAEGLKHDHPLARHLAMAKIAEYLDGTTEIQNVVIARDLFRKPAPS